MEVFFVIECERFKELYGPFATREEAKEANEIVAAEARAKDEEICGPHQVREVARIDDDLIHEARVRLGKADA